MAIAIGETPLPMTNASRHHFVPRFLLRNFTTPAVRGEPKLQLLDKTTGTITSVTTKGTAWERNLYAFDEDDGRRNNDVEAFLSVIESYAAEAIARFLADPLRLTLEDRQVISIYLALQEGRTPSSLAEKRELLRQTGTIWGAVELGKAKGKRRAQLREAQKALMEGTILLEPSDRMTVTMMFSALSEVAEVIANLPWLLQRAIDGEFVLSDRPLTRREPAPRHRFSAGAWASSPFVFTTLPLDPTHCLRVGQHTRAPVTVRNFARQVMATNLRTYGWGERYVLGRSADVLAELHARALREPETVARPVVQRLVMLEGMETADPAQAEANRARGWDRYIYHRDDDGSFEQLSYHVIESVDDARASIAPRPRPDADSADQDPPDRRPSTVS
jgi:hypothetical protein